MTRTRRNPILATTVLALASIFMAHEPARAEEPRPEEPRKVTIDTSVGADVANTIYVPSVARGFGHGPAVSSFATLSIDGLVPGTIDITGWDVYSAGDRHNPVSPGGGMHEVDGIVSYTSPKLAIGKWSLQARPSIQNWRYPSGYFSSRSNWVVQAEIDASRGALNVGVRSRRVVDGTPYGGGMAFMPHVEVSHVLGIPALERRGYSLGVTHGARIATAYDYFDRDGALGVDMHEAISLRKGPFTLHAEFGYVTSVQSGHPSGWHYSGGIQYKLPQVRLPMKRLFR